MKGGERKKKKVMQRRDGGNSKREGEKSLNGPKKKIQLQKRSD